MAVAMTFAFAAFISEVTPPGSDKMANAEAIIVAVTRSPFAPIGAGLLGILAMGNEFRHGTIITTLLVTPSRTRVLLSKVLSISVASVATAALTLVLGTIVCLNVLNTSATVLDSGPIVRTFAGFVILVTGWGLLGLGIVTLIRSQAAAILTLIGFATVVEPLVKSVLTMTDVQALSQVAGFLPFTAANSMIATSGGALSAAISEAAPSLEPWAGACVFAAFIALILLLAVHRFRRISI